MSSKIAYIVNEYPGVSHTFIRREILALERQDIQILRIALRGWDIELVDAQDRREQTKTRYVMQAGMLPLLLALAKVLVRSPGRFLNTVVLALKMGRRAMRPLPYHFAYLAEACRILPWLKSFGATHVHAHFGTNSAEVAMLIHALGGPTYSFTMHGTGEFDNIQFLGIEEKVNRASFVAAVSYYGRSQIFRWIERSQWHKVKLIHCGLEPAFYTIVPSPPVATPRLICVGRICKEKGQMLLVEAAHRLTCNGVEFELVLAGDGDLRNEVEALIVRYGLSRNVRITGWIGSNQVREEILAARALVLPSFSEGLPVVIMEAMALRRPVLATYVGGIPELVRPEENGWLVPAGSIDELTAAIEDLLHRTPDELRKMGEAGYSRVLEQHSIDTEAAKLAALFRHL